MLLEPIVIVAVSPFTLMLKYVCNTQSVVHLFVSSVYEVWLDDYLKQFILSFGGHVVAFSQYEIPDGY